MKMEMQSQTPIPAVTKNIPAMDLNYTEYKDDVSREPIVEEVEPERGNWTGRFDFLLSLLGYSVGLGNVWRFPYLCYNNGGGAFLIPFTVMLIIAGLPLMFMELSFGQYAALGPVAVYNRFCPLFRGLGYGMVIVSSIVMLYYNLIIAWTIYYMVVSFKSIFYQLPWQNCDADWSTKYCYSYEEADKCEAINGTYYLRQCINQSYAILNNIIALADTTVRKPPAEEYFTNQVLGLSSGIEETGQIRLGMAACLFAAWLIVFLCLFKGVQSSGKVVYFTALFPYLVLVILFFRGVTLPGAATGILFYLTPDFSQLANAQVWGDAAVQIFFALSPAWGGLITLSSYNKFSNNCYIDSLIVAVSNIATSFFAGLVIFSVIGFLAHELEVEVDRVVDQGAGLAFIVYPEVVTRLPVSPLWSILFFLMLLTLGLDSQFALMETVTTAILDRFPRFRQKKSWVVLSVAIFGYLGGLIFTTNSGMYWLQLMDKYAANWSVLIIAIGECILIAWIYGAEKFCIDIQTMIGRQSRLWVVFWSAMWRIITPAALVFILVFNWIEYKPASYGHYVYPMWADAVGWTLGVLPIFVVVLMAVNQICSGPDDLTIMETSQDGADSTSIASGLDNELKKPSTNTNKAKKNSIKRKVPNFSHDSDDAIIEPLLQTEKDNSVIANKSAKYLLNKSKTESLYEKDTKTFDNPKVTMPVSISTNVTTNIMIDKKASPLTSESPPIHNHMNTNVFSGYDLTKEKATTSNSILVEIDGCKAAGQGSSPVIFTTAKIHTDNKTKMAEPVQVTTVPILSTIQGNVVKSGVIYEDNKRYGILSTTKGDITKNSNIKSDLKMESSNLNDLTHVKIIPNIAPSSSIHFKNEHSTNKELQTAGPPEKSEKIFSKDQKISLTKSNANSTDQKSSIPKVTSDETVAKKVTPNKENGTCKTNGVLPDTSKEKIISSSKPNKLDKNNMTEKSKLTSDTEKTNEKQNTLPNTTSSKQIGKSNANISPQGDKTDIKGFSSSIKKLQRQKNAMIDDIKESDKKDSSNADKDKTSKVVDKGIATPVNLNMKTNKKTSNPATTISTTSQSVIIKSDLPQKSLNATVISPSTSANLYKSPQTSSVTSTTQNNTPRIATEVAKPKSASSKIPEPSVKLATKPSPISTKTSTVKSIKVTDDKPSPKQDTTSVTILPSKIPKTEPTTTSSVATTLPPYIVSTSKTKIGSSLTPSISTVTKKTPDQKPITEVVSTANGKSGKVLMSTSPSQSSQSGSKPKMTNVNITKKDDRA